MTPTRYPWAEHANQPGHVHVLRDVDPNTVASLAARWAKRNGFTVKTASIDDVMLVRFTTR